MQRSGGRRMEIKFCTVTSKTNQSGTLSDSGQLLTLIFFTRNELRLPGILNL